MGYRVSLSRSLLFLIFLTTIVSVCVCLASAVVLFLAPQVPYPSQFNGGDFTLYPALLLVLTALLSLLSTLLGCCGLSCDSKTTLMIYAFTVFMVAGAELASSGTVFGFAYSGEIKNQVGDVLKRDIMNFSEFDNSSTSYRVNSLQNKHECCGVYHYTDWRNMNTSWARKEAAGAQLAPESCCKTQYSAVDNCTTNSTMLHHTGCLNVLIDRLDIAVDCVLGACVVAACLNLLTAVLSCYGAWQIRKYQHYSII